MLDVGYLAAFLGGMLALLSPCSALLLPSFFAYAFSGPTRLLARTAVFFLGVAAVLVPLGAGSDAVAAQLTTHREALIQAAIGVIIALGVVQVLGGGMGCAPGRPNPGADGRPWHLSVHRRSGCGLRAGRILLRTHPGGRPHRRRCRSRSAVGRDPLRGAVLLAVYALGMAAPLFTLAGLWHRFDIGSRAWLRR